MNLQGKLKDQFELSQEMDKRREAVFAEGMEQSKQSQQQVMDRIEQLLNMQNLNANQQKEQLNQLLESFKQVVLDNHAANQGLKQSSQNMSSVANQLGVLSVNVKEAADALSKPVLQLLESNQQVAAENKAVFDQTQSLLSYLNRINTQIEQVSQTLLQATQHAESGFTALDQHLQAFKNGLKAHIEDLEEQLAKLLNCYAEQVQTQTYSRLNEWNEQTREYATTMKDVVETMASIVDEIETKSSGRH